LNIKEKRTGVSYYPNTRPANLSFINFVSIPNRLFR
jgi:hypothetical protein